MSKLTLAEKHDTLAVRAVEVTNELKNTINRCRGHVDGMNRDTLQVIELDYEAQQKELWRHVTREDGTPFRSITDYRDYMGIFSKDSYNGNYFYKLRDAQYTLDVTSKEDRREIGIAKLAELGRLYKALPSAKKNNDSWLAAAKKVKLKQFCGVIAAHRQKQLPDYNPEESTKVYESVSFTKPMRDNVMRVYEHTYKRMGTMSQSLGAYWELAALTLETDAQINDASAEQDDTGEYVSIPALPLLRMMGKYLTIIEDCDVSLEGQGLFIRELIDRLEKLL